MSYKRQQYTLTATDILTLCTSTAYCASKATTAGNSARLFCAAALHLWLWQCFKVLQFHVYVRLGRFYFICAALLTA
jgi:hypothetical protein